MSLEQKQIINQFVAEFGFDPFSSSGRQDKLRDAAQQALGVLEQLQGGCTDSDDGTLEVITVWCPEVVEALRAALAQQDAQAVRQGWIPPSGLKVADIGFRWDGDALQHVPHVLVEFAPVPANLPNTEKGWADRDAFVEMLNAAPTQPAPKPLGWLDRKAVECLQGPELNWMPAWNRPTSADPVPVFLGPPAQRVMLTDQEIRDLWSWSMTAEAERTANTQQHAFAQGVIEAYERKNGLKP